MAHKITLIIPTFRRHETLRKTVDTLLESLRLPDEVIIVDQTEYNNGAELIEAECKRIPTGIYLHSEIPSLTKARNVGLKCATGDIVVFMDDDVDVRPNTFSLISEIMMDKSIAMIGGFDVDSCSKYSLSSLIFGKASHKKADMAYVTSSVYGRFPNSMPTSMIDTEWAMGFFFAIRRSLAERWNIRFDEKLKYYAYAEDLDFTYSYYKKAKRENLRCVMAPEIKVKHNVSTEYRLISLKAYKMIYAHRAYLRKKHFGNLKCKISYLWCNLGDIIISIIRKRNTKDILKAQLFVKKYYKDIIAGEFHYEKFM